MKTTSQLIQKEIYTLRLTHPQLSDRDIGLKLNLANSTVSKYHNKHKRTIDYIMAQQAVTDFTEIYYMVTDYFKLHIGLQEERKEILDNFKEMTKTVYKQNMMGNTYTEQVSLEVSDLLSIFREETDVMKHQEKLWLDILEKAQQGNVLEVMKLIKSGRIKLPED